MFFVALLHTQPRRLTILPMSWVASLDVVQIWNIGVSQTKKHRVFYSPDLHDEPDFKLDLSEVFAENSKANHLATIRSTWGNDKIFLSDFILYSFNIHF